MIEELISLAVDSYRKAGRIITKLRNRIPDIVHEEMKVLDLCDLVEKSIINMGGSPAFPCNVGIGSIAAHYTSPPGDQSVIPKGSIIKVDFGVELSGYIADTAITISLNSEYFSMISAAEEALKVAIENVRSGVKVRDIGAMIEKCITKYGYKPIRNLTGHKIERYSLHSGKVIPNVAELNGSILEEGEVYAIEPFVTSIDANGTVEDLGEKFIYRFNKEKGAKREESKSLLRHILDKYRTLPFAFRWLERSYPEKNLRITMRELLGSRCILSYPVLVESSRRPVAQAEHTVIVQKHGCEVLTG